MHKSIKYYAVPIAIFGGVLIGIVAIGIGGVGWGAVVGMPIAGPLALVVCPLPLVWVVCPMALAREVHIGIGGGGMPITTTQCDIVLPNVTLCYHIVLSSIV